jgi:hypothetical protein
MGNNPDLNSSVQTLHPVINNNIYIEKKNNKKKNLSKNVTGCKTCSAEHEKEVEAAAKALLNYIGTDPDAYAKVVKPVNEITQKLNPNLYINPEEACPTNMATNTFFNDYLYPYLLKNSKGVRVATVMGGMPYGKQMAGLRGALIVVATPGRLLDLAQRRHRLANLFDAALGLAIAAVHGADHFARAGLKLLDHVAGFLH